MRAQGRLQEALLSIRASLRIYERGEHYINAATAASNLSEIELLVGQIGAATATAKKAVIHADHSGDAFEMMSGRTTLAEALHAAGDWKNAENLLADADLRQREGEPKQPLLYSLNGYRYCDLLLSQGRAAAARDRAAQTVEIARRSNWILEIALDNLTLGRAHLALASQSAVSGRLAKSASEDTSAAFAELDEAVEGLRVSGQNDDVPRGLIARSALRRAIGDGEGAARDLDEAKEIAEPALMRLYCCDCALEGARLALARREAFAPLNGLASPSPPPPVLPDPDAAAAALREEARKELDVARKLIAECGYHRRDEELAELDAVIAGGRRFADLPPRV